jgi:hypothetical protein
MLIIVLFHFFTQYNEKMKDDSKRVFSPFFHYRVIFFIKYALMV